MLELAIEGAPSLSKKVYDESYMPAKNVEYNWYDELHTDGVDRGERDSHSLDVAMDEFEVGDRPYHTRGCFNCIGFAALGPAMAMLGHFERVSPAYPTYLPTFNKALDALALIQPRLIVLAGGRADYGVPVSDKIALSDRTFAAETLTEFVQSASPSPELVIHWNNQQFESVDLFVDPYDKSITTVHRRLDE